ncbi:MAG: NADH-dependent dehydrogenase [Naasia sp.]|uniref:Gfo/Idh/MocA family protein n=1 Tax=Naasia sp. TaxID=2546198 RepID=UPI00263058A2|nr:Gfo/Idh/MocA family oxidoreductase [Naasia sp.]MCU1569766.1 NADH-dependent dehydrogenase [Naasia sp.]
MSGTGPVGVGVIGAGNISDQYLRTLTSLPDVQVLFVADLDEQRAAAQAEKYGVPGAGSAAELLARHDIEIVVNLTIPAVHAEVGMRVLAAGKHVWSEKPLALDRESGRALLEEGKRRGLRVSCAPDTFLGPGLQTVRRRVDDGSIGVPLTALTLFQTGGPERWHPSPDFFYAPGGGPLFDMGPYYLTELIQVFGPVKSVYALGSTSHETRTVGSGPRAGESIPVAVPSHVSAMLEFESGASAQCVFSFQSHLERTGFVEVAGTDGTVVSPDPNNFDGDVVVHSAAGDRTDRTTFSLWRGIGVLELARAIRADRTERASGAQAFHVLDIMASISDSVTQGAPVAVESTVERPDPLPEDWDPTAATL